jgi:hypothetical protein
MRYSTNNIGALIAVLTGVFSIALSVWPGSPQYTEHDSILWVGFNILIGVGFITAAAIVNRSLMLARVLLAGGALLRVASGVFFGAWFDDGAAPFFVDVLPAIFALIAAVLIGPIRRGAVP